jgi:hypothetical protein
VVPNIIGCVFWPPFYFLPGILAGAAIDIPDGCKAVSLNGCCWHGCAAVAGGMAVLAAVAQRESGSRSPDALSSALAPLWLAPLTLGCVVALVALIRHPLMPVYGEILLKVVSR